METEGASRIILVLSDFIKTAANFELSFLPYDLYLEEEEDIDTLVNNIINFHCWCAARVLTLDRKYAKEILKVCNRSDDLLQLF